MSTVERLHCPVCQTAVRESERRVVCPECGYHIKEPESEVSNYGFE